MVVRTDIKKDLPDFPDEVIDMWLLPLANQQGMSWPPPNPFGTSRWQWLLGENLDWWKKVDWKLEDTDCSFNAISDHRACREDQKAYDCLSCVWHSPNLH